MCYEPENDQDQLGRQCGCGASHGRLFWPQHDGADGRPCEYSGRPWDIGEDNDRNGCSLYPTTNLEFHT